MVSFQFLERNGSIANEILVMNLLTRWPQRDLSSSSKKKSSIANEHLVQHLLTRWQQSVFQFLVQKERVLCLINHSS